MEPWDGPASIAFTDGVQIGAVLDRNGLRPSRYYVTKDGLVVMASEAGVLDIAPENVVLKGRLQPGRMFLVDTEQGRIVRRGDQARDRHANAVPSWLDENLITSTTCPPPPVRHEPDHETLLQRQQAFGYTFEDLQILLGADGATASRRSARWATTRRSRCSRTGRSLLYNYFKQLFAQVTNPPVDCIREEIIMSAETGHRLRGQPARARADRRHRSSSCTPDPHQRGVGEAPAHGRLPGPARFKASRCRSCSGSRRGEGLVKAMEELVRLMARGDQRGLQHHHPVRPRRHRETRADPGAARRAAVHHHLIREGLRTRVGLVLETGEPREVHHFALLIGYGAARSTRTWPSRPSTT